MSTIDVDRVLSFTADEVLVLTDRVRNDDAGTDGFRVDPYPLLLKLGSAYVELLGETQKATGAVPLALSEAECWLLRSKVNSGDKSASDPMFGVKLLRKLYLALLAFNQPDLNLPESAEPGPQLTQDWKDALKRRAGG